MPMTVRLAAIVFVAPLLAGCSLLQPKPKMDAAVGLFEKASLTYVTNAWGSNISDDLDKKL